MTWLDFWAVLACWSMDVQPTRPPGTASAWPVLNQQYAVQFARDSNVPAYGMAYVTAFDVRSAYLARFEVQNVGGELHNELWVPAEDLDEFNQNIVGCIRLTQTFF